jgi:ABC-type uncharacterized transport system substrate-binding protein
MRRREFFALLGGAAAWPITGHAQTPQKMPRIGMISSGNQATYGRHVEAFRQSLREFGYVDGQTIALEVRWAEGSVNRLSGLVAELVHLNVDVLVIANGLAALEGKRVTQSIPIVMYANDPIGLGLVASLARPGGNVTGLSLLSVDISGKRLELLKELIPDLARVAVLRDPNFPPHALFWQETEAAARKLRIALQAVEARGSQDLEASFGTALRGNAQALLAFDGPLTQTNRSLIIALAAKHHLPDMYGFREHPDEGGLMSYGPSLVDSYQRFAGYVDKILKGTKPAELPVEQPTKSELVINMKTAKALGIAIPAALLARVDELIE